MNSRCPRCGSDNTTPLNLESTVFECVKCNERFHVGGIAVNDVVIQPRLDGDLVDPIVAQLFGSVKNAD